MADIKINIESIKNLNEYLNKNNFETVSHYLNNFVNFNNSNISHKELIAKSMKDESIDLKRFIDELIYFLNIVDSSVNLADSEVDNFRKIEKILHQFDINVNYTKELIYLLNDIIQNLRRKNLSNTLVSYDWQLSMIEKENEKTSVNLNKFDKVEVAVQMKIFDNKTEEYKNNLIKMGYNEFYEIFQNLKKIDGQLHLFKN